MASKSDSIEPKSPAPRSSGSGGWDLAPEDETTNVTTLSPEAKELVARSKSRRPCLIALMGGNMGETFPLGDGDIVLGRGTQATIRITGEGISRRHARLIREGANVVVEDLESANGTFVNDERVRRHVLRDGDKLRLASTSVLKFTFQDRLDEAFQRQMFDAALRDGLTQVFNRKYILDRLTTELAYARRHRISLTFLMMDIDHFKLVNDRFGHLAGDRVLAQVAKAASTTLRAEDVFGRYGGEEFCVICRGISSSQASILAERLRSCVAATRVDYEGERIAVTVSIGVASFPRVQADSSQDLVAAADEALYKAKEDGRNRVIMAG